MSWKLLDDEETKARKILGAGAVFPKQKVDLQALVNKTWDANTKFKTARDGLEKLLEALENAFDAYKNGLKTAADAYEVNDFGLDKNNKDDLKKIEQAQTMFSAFFNGKIKELTEYDKAIDELQKHLEQLSKYKGPK